MPKKYNLIIKELNTIEHILTLLSNVLCIKWANVEADP